MLIYICVDVISSHRKFDWTLQGVTPSSMDLATTPYWMRRVSVRAYPGTQTVLAVRFLSHEFHLDLFCCRVMTLWSSAGTRVGWGGRFTGAGRGGFPCLKLPAWWAIINFNCHFGLSIFENISFVTPPWHCKGGGLQLILPPSLWPFTFSLIIVTPSQVIWCWDKTPPWMQNISLKIIPTQ